MRKGSPWSVGRVPLLAERQALFDIIREGLLILIVEKMPSEVGGRAALFLHRNCFISFSVISPELQSGGGRLSRRSISFLNIHASRSFKKVCDL